MRKAIEVHNYRTAIHELFILKESQTRRILQLFDTLQADFDGEIELDDFESQTIMDEICDLTEYAGEIHYRYLDSLHTRKNRPVSNQYYDDGENRYKLVGRYNFHL